MVGVGVSEEVGVGLLVEVDVELGVGVGGQVTWSVTGLETNGPALSA